jgi:hypothetical protein
MTKIKSSSVKVDGLDLEAEISAPAWHRSREHPFAAFALSAIALSARAPDGPQLQTSRQLVQLPDRGRQRLRGVQMMRSIFAAQISNPCLQWGHAYQEGEVQAGHLQRVQAESGLPIARIPIQIQKDAAAMVHQRDAQSKSPPEAAKSMRAIGSALRID